MLEDLSKQFQFPIKGYILFSGHGHLIAAFSDHRHAMDVQQLMAKNCRGSSYTVMWCDGYHTMRCDEKEDTAANGEAPEGEPVC